MSELIWRCTFNCQQRHVFVLVIVHCRQFQIVSTFFFSLPQLSISYQLVFLSLRWRNNFFFRHVQLLIVAIIIDSLTLTYWWGAKLRVCWKLISNCPFSLHTFSATWNIGHKLHRKKKRFIKRFSLPRQRQQTTSASTGNERNSENANVECYGRDKQHPKWYQQQKHSEIVFHSSSRSEFSE